MKKITLIVINEDEDVYFINEQAEDTNTSSEYFPHIFSSGNH